jgi:2-polyprenyl-3-methyl-5-hydroxy-6-metoxy-1,4-benzoquinol methylase/glycosyltransferase involved in cell wall biosynthesis
MSVSCQSQGRRVIALIATCNRQQLLLSRALPSINAQSSPCDHVVLIDDGDQRLDRLQIEHFSSECDLPIAPLTNRRTKGASGAWNTGIDHLARNCLDPSLVYVALLDDDDAWHSNHLASLESAIDKGAEVIATGFRRLVDTKPSEVVIPPQQLRPADFFFGNPGIQPTSLVIRLDRLLEAGCFDEALQSCTDRDLCIRLARLPGIRYHAINQVTADHFACTDRARLCTPGSAARTSGLQEFFAKYSPEMNAVQEVNFLERAKSLFNWSPASSIVPKSPEEVMLLPAVENPLHLIVGLISDSGRCGPLHDLLTDIAALQGDQGLSGLDVLILENGSAKSGETCILEVAQRWREQGLRVHLIDCVERDVASENGELLSIAPPGQRWAISQARTALQTYLYHFAVKRPGSVVWIVDDDMRLDPLIDTSGHKQRLRLPMQARLAQLKDQGVDVAIGPYTGAPPLPVLSTVRVQMVDLLASLRWMECLEPTQPLPDRRAENFRLRADRRDYYYDLSHGETDRLESAFLLEPATKGETTAHAMSRLVGQLNRLLTGEQIFRPLTISVAEVNSFAFKDSLHRGGNTFVFNIETLIDAPNAVPDIEGRPTRRSDMMWALLLRHQFNRRVVLAPLPTYHAREALITSSEDDEQCLADDIRGFAMFTAMQDYLADRDVYLGARAEKYREERLAAFRLAVYRIRGLALELQALAERPAFAQHNLALRSFADNVLSRFDVALLNRVIINVRKFNGTQAQHFLAELPNTIAKHRLRTFNAPIVEKQLQAQRVRQAEQALRIMDAGKPLSSLRPLGAGSEAVVLTDGERVFKVFDSWKSRDSTSTQRRLHALVGRWPRGPGLYPLQAFQKVGMCWVLSYPYEPSEPYLGGQGAGLVDLMADCWNQGLICRNIHPKNLRVVGPEVRLIDYGSDLLLREESINYESEFKAMCRRAFLSWRFWNRLDLADLMRSSIKNEFLPELTGYDVFDFAVQQAIGKLEFPDPVLERALRLSHSRTLDFGCGKGTISAELARRGHSVVAYDPDATLTPRLQAMTELEITQASSMEVALSGGKFDLVICRRVICLLHNDALAQVLDELRLSVNINGRVLLALCHPLHAPGMSTHEVVATGSRPQDPESVFTWTKRHRRSSRLLHEVHRPERTLRRAISRAGFRIVGRYERSAINLDRFEYASDLLVFELAPTGKPEVSLMIKACAMEAATLTPQVRHLITQLESPRPFAEVVLVLDTRRDGFLRQHAAGDSDRLYVEASMLQQHGWVDRIVHAPEPEAESQRLNRHWLGQDRNDTHAANGAPLSATFIGFESIRTRWVLQVDVDVIIGRKDTSHDYLADMLEAMAQDENAVTVAFNIAHTQNHPYTNQGPIGSWRAEVRNCLLDIRRLQALLPLCNSERAALPAWHRALDQRICSSGAHSLRGGDHRTFFVHPANEHKQTSSIEYWRMVSRISRGDLLTCQFDSVDLVAPPKDWVTPTRFEPFVFVIAGRNVPPSRFLRCLKSVLTLQRDDWGAVVIDDDSSSSLSMHLEAICANHAEKITFLRNPVRQGLLSNTVEAIRHHVGNPDAVIITLDADDCLIGTDVIDVLAEQYEDGADLTVGSMCRTDKRAAYPVKFPDARTMRGGSVWQHLRSFRKRLFDQLPDEQLRIEGNYVDIASDWALMLPLVELARNPRWIQMPLYLHEPGDIRNDDYRAKREHVISTLVARPALHVQSSDDPSGDLK